MFAESSSDGWVGVATALIGALSTIVLAYLAYLQVKLKSSIESAAHKAENAATKAAVEVGKASKTSEEQDRKLDAIHVLVNSNMAVQLGISAVALRRIADLTRHPEDVAAAELAEKMLAEHEQKQNTVDRQEGKQG